MNRRKKNELDIKNPPCICGNSRWKTKSKAREIYQCRVCGNIRTGGKS